jgi:hypothetical protein
MTSLIEKVAPDIAPAARILLGSERPADAEALYELADRIELAALRARARARAG